MLGGTVGPNGLGLYFKIPIGNRACKVYRQCDGLAQSLRVQHGRLQQNRIGDAAEGTDHVGVSRTGCPAKTILAEGRQFDCFVEWVHECLWDRGSESYILVALYTVGQSQIPVKIAPLKNVYDFEK